MRIGNKAYSFFLQNIVSLRVNILHGVNTNGRGAKPFNPVGRTDFTRKLAE